MLMQIDHGELRIKAIASARSSQLTLLKRFTDELSRLAHDYYAMLIAEAREALESKYEDLGDINADLIDALDDIAFHNDAKFIDDGEFFRFIKIDGVYHA
jgi:hypothetical protein